MVSNINILLANAMQQHQPFDNYYKEGVILLDKRYNKKIVVDTSVYTPEVYVDTIYDSIGFGIASIEDGFELEVPLTNYLTTEATIHCKKSSSILSWL